MLMILVPLPAVLFVSLQGVLKLNTTYRKLTNLYYEKIYKADGLILNSDRDMYQSLIALKALSQKGVSKVDRKNEIVDLNENVNQTRDRMKNAIDILTAIKSEIRESKDKDTNKNVFESYNEFVLNYELWLKQFDISTGKISDPHQFNEAFDAARGNIDTMTNTLDLVAQNSKIHMKEYINTTIVQFSILAFSVIAITLILGVIISRDSTKVLIKIKDLAARLSNYDFSKDLMLKRSDEFGQTADILNRAQQNVRVLVDSIIDKTKNIDSDSQQLAI
ncbi:methyl-accepting chemotaxis protein [Clostridium oryzae]|uniref:HAMP domain protein n=1 Tax=Clostridium oryzae TaxID=1450648 RepID=A0A1V4IQ67_9CLOT|nr:methyl-accepting chemotaxis protein [Clostridium oryzae]OPJ61960.1 HAMP domain protein [Clostridium oryzae]